MTLASSIAIDGPAASGKSAVGRALAQTLGYLFLDTGDLYRALAYLALVKRIHSTESKKLSLLARTARFKVQLDAHGPTKISVDCNDVTPYLRDPQVDEAVPHVARIVGVRKALVRFQRELAEAGPIVMIGRDIGTVVLPETQYKFFLQASIEERVKRRHAQLNQLGKEFSLEQIKEQLLARDSLDIQRKESPLRPSLDAFVVDTDRLTVNEVVEKMIQLLSHQLDLPSSGHT